MSYVRTLKKYKLQVITLLFYGVTLAYNEEILINALGTTGGYLKEMLTILPAVFILSGLITTWVPKEVIMKNFGEESGFKGKLISILIGAVSAGPIYAAFPVAYSLLGKGASISNIVVIISSWAVVKIPMMFVETKFLGLNFMLSRSLLTIPAILVIGYMTEKLMKKGEVVSSKEPTELDRIVHMEQTLPQYNCGACGYDSCRKYAESLVKEEPDTSLCKIGGDQIKEKIETILYKNQNGGDYNGSYQNKGCSR